MREPAAKLYIIRHGQTEMNQRQVLQGRSDLPLNAAGEAQARQAAERLKGVRFDHVFTSPLQRAVQTARILVPAASCHQEPDIYRGHQRGEERDPHWRSKISEPDGGQ